MPDEVVCYQSLLIQSQAKATIQKLRYAQAFLLVVLLCFIDTYIIQPQAIKE